MEGQPDNHLIRTLHFIKMHQRSGPFIMVQFNYGKIYAQNLIKVSVTVRNVRRYFAVL